MSQPMDTSSSDVLPLALPETRVVTHRTLEVLLGLFVTLESLVEKTFTGQEAQLLLRHHGIVVYKFTNEAGNHRGVQYAEGVVRDICPFDSNAKCLSGIYCAYGDRFSRWFNYKTKDGLRFENTKVFDVAFLPESTVTFESREKLKSDVIVLSNGRSIKEFEAFWNTPEKVSTILSVKGKNIIQAPWMSDLLYCQLPHSHYFTRAEMLNGAPVELILAALDRDPYLIKGIPHPTPEMKRAAIRSDGLVLSVIGGDDDEEAVDESLETLAVHNKPAAIQFVKAPSRALIYHAMHEDAGTVLIALVRGGKAALIEVKMLQSVSKNEVSRYATEVVTTLCRHDSIHLVPEDVLLHLFDADYRSLSAFFHQMADRKEYSIPQTLLEGILQLASPPSSVLATVVRYYAIHVELLSDDVLEKLLHTNPDLIRVLHAAHKASPTLWKFVLSHQGTLIEDLEKDQRSEALCWTALRQNPAYVFAHVTLTPEMRAYALNAEPVIAIRLGDATEAELMKAIKKCPNMALQIPQAKMTHALKMEAIRLNHTLVQRLFPGTTLTHDILTECVRVNPRVAFLDISGVFTNLMTEEHQLAAVEAAIAHGWLFLRDECCVAGRKLDCNCSSYTKCHCRAIIGTWKSGAMLIDRIVSAFPELIVYEPTLFAFTDEQYMRAFTANHELITATASRSQLSMKVWKHVLEQHPAHISLLVDPAEELQMEVVYRNPTNIQYITKPCTAAMTFALMSDPTCTNLIKHDGGFARKFQDAVMVPRNNKKRALASSNDATDAEGGAGAAATVVGVEKPEVSDAKRIKLDL